MKTTHKGILLFFATLWGGSYIIGNLPAGHWAIFPAGCTAVWLTLYSIFFCHEGMLEEEYKKDNS